MTNTGKTTGYFSSSYCARSEASPEIASGPGSFGHSLNMTWKKEETEMKRPVMPHFFQPTLRTQEIIARMVVF